MYHAITMIISMVLTQVFAMPYIMAASTEDVYFSVTQGWMGAAMGALMVAADGLLHPLPLWVWVLTVAVFVGAVLGYRYQVGVSDREYLHDMIPHHSMAVLTSKRILAKTTNPAVVRLAESIRDAQVREIAEMRQLLQNGL
jgi:uncharacterized protein (DUF305 family)